MNADRIQKQLSIASPELICACPASNRTVKIKFHEGSHWIFHRRSSAFIGGRFWLWIFSLACASASATEYPARPIRVIVPYPAGGPVDITLRAIAPRVSDTLRQTIVIDNRGGAGGTIGSDLVAKAAADGHTLLACSTGNTINATLVPSLPYDFARDFAPISMLAIITSILVVNPAVPARSVAELVALAKAQPGKLSYASTGNGTPTHLAAELFKRMAGVEIVHVPYKGGAPAAVDLLAGQVQLSFISAPAVMPHVKSQRLRALAVTNAKRSQLLPALPTIAESGLPGFESEGWHGLCGPARLSTAVVDILYRATGAALRSPEVAALLANGGAEATPMPPAPFAALIRADIAKWAKIIKASDVRPD
jgi:tripartite-type tricarboxylate transporter receptor subunit TctC